MLTTSTKKSATLPQKSISVTTKASTSVRKPFSKNDENVSKIQRANKPLVQANKQGNPGKPESLIKYGQAILGAKNIKTNMAIEPMLATSCFSLATRIGPESRFKTPHYLYSTKDWKVIHMRRIRPKQFAAIEKNVPRRFYKSLNKSVENLSSDLSISAKKLSFPTNQTTKRNPCINSSLIKKIDLDVSHGGDRKIYLHGEYLALKRLRNITSCVLNLHTAKDFILLTRLVKRWRYVDNLTIVSSSKWTNKHWLCLKSLLSPRLKTLNLEIKLSYEDVKNSELIKCAQRIQSCDLTTVRLALEVDSENSIGYFLEQCGYLTTAKALIIQCIGTNFVSGLDVMTYQFHCFVDTIIPRTLHYTQNLHKLSLDFSNETSNSYKIDNTQIKALSEALVRLENIKELELNLSNFAEKRNCINDKGLECLQGAIKKFNNIRFLSLNLAHTNVSEKGTETFLKGMSCISSLRLVKIGVAGNGIKYGKLEDAIFNFEKNSKALCRVVY